MNKEETIQFIENCYIPNNTFYSVSDLPSGWQDYIDGNADLSYNLSKVDKLLKMSDRDEDRRLMEGMDYKAEMEKYSHLWEKWKKQNL